MLNKAKAQLLSFMMACVFLACLVFESNIAQAKALHPFKEVQIRVEDTSGKLRKNRVFVEILDEHGNSALFQNGIDHNKAIFFYERGHGGLIRISLSNFNRNIPNKLSVGSILTITVSCADVDHAHFTKETIKISLTDGSTDMGPNDFSELNVLL